MKNDTKPPADEMTPEWKGLGAMMCVVLDRMAGEAYVFHERCPRCRRFVGVYVSARGVQLLPDPSHWRAFWRWVWRKPEQNAVIGRCFVCARCDYIILTPAEIEAAISAPAPPPPRPSYETARQR